MDEQQASVLELGSDVGLTDQETGKLLTVHGFGPDVSDGPITTAAELQDTLERLNRDGVQNLDGFLRKASANGFEGTAGEAKTAQRLLDSGVSGSDVEIGRDVPFADVETVLKNDAGLASSDYKRGTDIDLNTRTDGTTFESKNREYSLEGSSLPDDIAADVLADDINSLRQKLNTYAAWAVRNDPDGNIRIVVTTRAVDPDAKFADEVIQKLPARMSGIESFGDLADRIESNFEDIDGVERVNVEFKSYDEVSG
jgi:hypothetical protein